MFLGYQRICASFTHKAFAHQKDTRVPFCYDEQVGYAELYLMEDKPGWQKFKPVERVYVKYDPKNNIPTQEATLPNHIVKKVKVLTSSVCVTNEANQNLTPSHKELLRWHFRLGFIGFQHIQCLIRAGRLKVQRN